jgi:hypothetical protein
MKRASFFFAFICLALLSFGQVYGQNGAVSLSSVDGLSVGQIDKIECGQPVTFYIRAEVPAGDATIFGVANGFKIYSPDGATWDPWLKVDTNIIVFPPPETTEYDTTYYGEWLDSGLPTGLVWKGADPQVLDGGIFVNTFSEDGANADTCGFAGFQQEFGTGLYATFVADPAWGININSTNCADTGLQLCIDSSYFPPSGKWLWADGVSYEPSWDGPHCYTIFKTPNPLRPRIAVQSVIRPTSITATWPRST